MSRRLQTLPAIRDRCELYVYEETGVGKWYFAVEQDDAGWLRKMYFMSRDADELLSEIPEGFAVERQSLSYPDYVAEWVPIQPKFGKFVFEFGGTFRLMRGGRVVCVFESVCHQEVKAGDGVVGI